MSKELDQALAALAEAKPTPEAVKQLAAATIARRETPYQGKQHSDEHLQFATGRNESTTLILTSCAICGAVIQIRHLSQRGFPGWSESQHLRWHNDQERRLRKLEEKEA